MAFCYGSLNGLEHLECSCLGDMRSISQFILIDTYYISNIILGSGDIGMTKTNEVLTFHKLTFY